MNIIIIKKILPFNNRIIAALAVLFFLSHSLETVFSQNITQTVRGQVIDRDTKIPLPGVNVIVNGSVPAKVAVTDEKGNFHLDGIPVGRVDIKLSYVGYEDMIIPNILVSSGKEVIVNPELQESLTQIEEIKITAKKNKADVLNEMALVSSRSFSVDETKRYAGSINDPSRMVSSYAGVTSDPAGNNDIVVRGNSPKGILWRLEGIDIPNPNHFSDEGSTGGPINALNSDMLSNSDFYTGAFSPEYGNVLSGVFDMKLRSGNNEKREYSFGFGVLGTDLTLEGPFKRNYAGSYLVNYRYSSLALLNNAGIVDFDGIPKYQDASFKCVTPTKNIGTFSLFGLGGISHIFETEEYRQGVTEKTDYSSRLGVIGLNHTYSFNDNNYLKTSLSMTGNGSGYDEDEQIDSAVHNNKGHWYKTCFTASTALSNKLNSKNRIVSGVTYAYYNYDLFESEWDSDLSRQVEYINTKKGAGLVQAYTLWKYRLNNNVTFVNGVHFLNFLLNKKFSIEPRAALKWQINNKHSLNFGFGVHSKIESIIAYNTILTNPDGKVTLPNINMDLTKAQHFVSGYEYRINNNLNAKMEVYYQYLYNVPVENVDSSIYSMLNSDEGYIDRAMVNKGAGRNYGAEFTLERYFNKSYYFLLTTSLYNSTYKTLEGKERNTKYNGNYAVNFLIGKEFKLGEKSKILGVNAKFFYQGGRRYLPLNIDASIAQNKSVWNYKKAYENKLDNIFQINLTMSYRINRLRAGHEFVVEVLNLSNNQARIQEYYNRYKGVREYDTQLSLLPNFMYRIHF